MASRRIIVVGGGAAGFFAAITCAEAAPGMDVTVLEKSPRFLAKVLISGGGRCNVAPACFDTRALGSQYPRGEKTLLAAFTKFSPRDTVEWFDSRGVKLKTEPDGRMFPVTDSSRTIADCLLQAARDAGVIVRTHCGVDSVKHRDGQFELSAGGETLHCDRLLLAAGGCRTPAIGQLVVALGHTLIAPVPSLFTFHIEVPWLRALAGVSLESAALTVPGAGLAERGALLVTHWGLSGPAVLRLSAWGARKLHTLDYRFPLLVNWLPECTPEQLTAEFLARRETIGARLVANAPIAPLTARLWEALVQAAGIGRETRWSAFTRAQQHALIQQLTRTEFAVTGKSLNKDEFVTCGGVKLGEVDFKTMESRVCPGLYFAGEMLDLDGITGGYNFQAAWTTGWLAGQAMAK